MELANINAAIEFGELKPVARTLLNAKGVRVLLLCIRSGQTVPEHSAPGPITVQALTGRTLFYDGEDATEMGPGAIVLLAAGRPHKLQAKEDATLVVTICTPESGSSVK